MSRKSISEVRGTNNAFQFQNEKAGTFPNEKPQPLALGMTSQLVDYGEFRRKGYFLDKGDWKGQPKQNKNKTFLLENELEVVAEPVRDWLASIPEGAPYLIDSEDDLMGGIEKDKGDKELDKRLYDNFISNAETQFKLKILEGTAEGHVKYTSVPGPVLNLKELEPILEFANERVDKCLEEFRQDPNRLEYEYVCGTATYSENCASSCGIILEPYHGPVALNGATIQAGSANMNQKRGIFQGLVEDVKVALLVISRALRRDVFPAFPTTPSISLSEVKTVACEEDAEIQRLSELIINSKSRKSTLRSVFGFRDLSRVPRSLNARTFQEYGGGRGRLFRAVEGFIRRTLRTSGRGQEFVRNSQQSSRINGVDPSGNQLGGRMTMTRNAVATTFANFISYFQSTLSREAPAVHANAHNTSPRLPECGRNIRRGRRQQKTMRITNPTP